MTSLSIGLYPRRVFCTQPSFVHSWSCPRAWDQWACWSESSPPDICHRVWQSSSDSSPPLRLHPHSIRHSNPRNHNPHLSRQNLYFANASSLLANDWIDSLKKVISYRLDFVPIRLEVYLADTGVWRPHLVRRCWRKMYQLWKPLQQIQFLIGFLKCTSQQIRVFLTFYWKR